MLVKNGAKLLLLGYRFPSLSESVPIPNFEIEYPVLGSDSGCPNVHSIEIYPLSFTILGLLAFEHLGG